MRLKKLIKKIGLEIAPKGFLLPSALMIMALLLVLGIGASTFILSNSLISGNTKLNTLAGYQSDGGIEAVASYLKVYSEASTVNTPDGYKTAIANLPALPSTGTITLGSEEIATISPTAVPLPLGVTSSTLTGWQNIEVTTDKANAVGWMLHGYR